MLTLPETEQVVGYCRNHETVMAFFTVFHALTGELTLLYHVNRSRIPRSPMHPPPPRARPHTASGFHSAHHCDGTLLSKHTDGLS